MPPKVRLTWSEGAPSQPGTGFKIHRSVNGGAFSHVAKLPLSQTSWEEDVNYGNTYTYRVYEYLSLPNGDVLSTYAARSISIQLVEDSAYGQDGQALFVYRSSTDQGTGQEASQLSALIARQDTAAEIEQALLRVFGLDQGTAEDNSALAAALSSLDSGLGEELLTGRLVAALEEGEGEEAALPFYEAVVYDESPGLDHFNLQAFIAALDQEGVDEFSSLQAALFSAEQGEGEESALPFYEAAAYEEGPGLDYGDLQAFISVLDQEETGEFSSPWATLSSIELGLGEEASLSFSFSSAFDQGLGADQEALQAFLLSVDEALSSESSALSALLSLWDSGQGAEDFWGLARNVLDSASEEEESFLSASIFSFDTAGSLDSSQLEAFLHHLDSTEGIDEAPLPAVYFSLDDILAGEELAFVSCSVLDLERAGTEDFLSLRGAQWKDSDQVSGQEQRYFLFVRQPGTPWGWKVYELSGLPEQIVRIVRALGERGTPSDTRVKKPKASPRD